MVLPTLKNQSNLSQKLFFPQTEANIVLIWNGTEIKMRFKKWSLKNYFFQPESTVMGFNKILQKLWSFCANSSEQNETKRHFVLKEAYFLPKSHSPPSMNKF